MEMLPFIKMHGLGNDYVYIDCFSAETSAKLAGIDLAALTRSISDRHTGVGSDGLVLIMPSQVADVRMRMFNADGSEAQMCGNASRCVAKYAYEQGLCGESMTLETIAGIKSLMIHTASNDRVEQVTVEMGQPQVKMSELSIKGQTYSYIYVNMGNPHAVVFTDQPLNQLPLSTIGPLWEHHKSFPEGINTEFVHVENKRELHMRVWERGSGETMACGTGACAAAVAAYTFGRTGNNVTVHLKGGDLSVRIDDNNTVYMTGTATRVFRGTYLWEN